MSEGSCFEEVRDLVWFWGQKIQFGFEEVRVIQSCSEEVPNLVLKKSENPVWFGVSQRAQSGSEDVKGPSLDLTMSKDPVWFCLCQRTQSGSE